MNKTIKHRIVTVKGYCHKNWRLILIAAVITVTGALIALFFVKTALPVKAYVTEATAHEVHKPVVIKLNQKLVSIDTSRLSISPKIDGEWDHMQGTLLASDELTFKPKTVFKTATKYTVEVSGIKRVIVGENTLEKVSFNTERAPSLTFSTNTDTQPLGAVSPFIATLSSANRNLRDLQLRTAPGTELVRSSSDDRTFKWTPKQSWPQGKTIEVELYDTTNGQSLKKATLLVATEPTIATPVKTTYFTDKDRAEITFSQPIDRTKEPAIDFDLAGKGEWVSDTVYAFTPVKVEPAKTYTYKIEAGLRSKQGGVLLQPYEGTFKTTGAVSVIATAPSGSQLRQSNQEIAFTFDQPVDKSSAEQRFSISNGEIGQKRWAGNILYVQVANLGYQQTVTAQIAAGVGNAGFGLPSSRSFGMTFTTESRVTRLQIPFYRQQHSATCAVASLRMALAYRGINASEQAIVTQMGYQPRSIDASTNPPTWDDPTEMFVGSIDGSIKSGTGAGPDAPPVAKAAQLLSRNATAITGASTGWIASHIHAGNPVVMFGAQSASSGTRSWQTPEGKLIVMNLTSHAVLVTGVVGEPSSPIGFWVNDPLSGGTAYWSAAAVAANISRDPSKQAVVVY